jgi:hypothetical protein
MAAGLAPGAAAQPAGQAAASVPATPGVSLQDAQDIADVVLAGLEKQIDHLLDQRVQESLAPAFERLCEGLVQSVRDDLANTLRDVVARAVAQELARRQGR